MRRVYVSVSDDSNIVEFLKWIERRGLAVVSGGSDLNADYPFVVVNFPKDSPKNEEESIEKLRLDDVYALLKAVSNYRESVPLVDPTDYRSVMESFEKCGDVPLQERKRLAVKAMCHVISHLSKIHSRLAELFALLDFEHSIYEVIDRRFVGETVEELLVDTLKKFSGSVGRFERFLPVYLSVMNEIPEGSSVVFKDGLPVHASMSLVRSSEGNVLVHKGEIEGDLGYDLVVARRGPENVVKYEPSDEDVFTLGSNGIMVKWERRFDNMTDTERLAHAFTAFSPVPTAAVFDGNGLLDYKRSLKVRKELLNLPDGVVLAVNFHLENVPRGDYVSVVAPGFSEELRRSGKFSRLVSRPF